MGRRTRAPPPEPPTGAGGGRGVEYENKGGTRIGVEGGGRRQRGGRPLAGGVHLFLRGGGGSFRGRVHRPPPPGWRGHRYGYHGVFVACSGSSGGGSGRRRRGRCRSRGPWPVLRARSYHRKRLGGAAQAPAARPPPPPPTAVWAASFGLFSRFVEVHINCALGDLFVPSAPCKGNFLGQGTEGKGGGLATARRRTGATGERGRRAKAHEG